MIGDLFDSPWKILIVAVVLIVLFGSKKLPHAARSLGQSMRILKKEVQGLHEDETVPGGPAQAQASTGSANGFPPAELTVAPQPDQQQSQIDATCSGPRRWIRLRSKRSEPSNPASSWLEVGSGGRR